MGVSPNGLYFQDVPPQPLPAGEGYFLGKKRLREERVFFIQISQNKNLHLHFKSKAVGNVKEW
jgi:hypothetical protein